jgi:hypothetical protein
LNISENIPKENSLGCGLISVAKKEAFLEEGFYSQIIVDYSEDYQEIDYEVLFNSKDQVGNNILHCLAKTIVCRFDIYREDEDWHVYKEIVQDSNLWNVNLEEQENQSKKTPKNLLLAVGLNVNQEVIIDKI